MGDITQGIHIADKLLRGNSPETNLVININIRLPLTTRLHPEQDLFFMLAVGGLLTLLFSSGTVASFVVDGVSIKDQPQSAVFINFSLAATFDLIRIAPARHAPSQILSLHHPGSEFSRLQLP